MIAVRVNRSWVASVQRYSLIVMLVIITILFASVSKPFFSVSNLDNILLQSAATAIAAVGMTFVIIIAEIDISIGSLMSLAMTIAWMIAVVPGAKAGEAAAVNAWVYPVGLAAGLVLGLLNGLLITGLRINALIATLATMFAFRGAALKMVGASDKAFLHSAVMYLGRREMFGVGLPVYVMIAVAAIGTLVLGRTPVGRYLYAIGGSQRSAVETGLPVDRMRLVAYGVSGLCTAIAGLIIISQVGTLQASLGTGFEFTVITAVVVGGTSLLGGRGTIAGSILGAVLLVVINNGLNLINASVYIYDVVKGVILIAAVMIDVLLLHHLEE
ncbi:MAG TPA: ABC transporter permease [Acetobacteraceae bacterium]|nr:ABC transporter permease [Acetobacteraceae bacterium]